MSAAGSPAPAGPVLVAAKLHVPALRAGMVSRGELVGRLTGGGGCKLVLVCAPAGWGKTSVLSQWHSAEPGVFAWVSLDPGDDDRVRFWSYVIGAVRTVAPEVGEAALAALPNASGDLAGAVLPSLLNELAAAGRRVVLVLDDYHWVREESIHASVAFVLRHLPPNVQLAIATRADPPLPLGSLRAAGEVLEIRATQLRFSDAEAGALLNDSLALGLEPAEVALLRERTEGWPAGLRLAALSLRDQADRQAFVASFAGDDRQIAEYPHEFVAAQPRRLREFLLRTSILERLCASVCDAVTGRSDGIARLEEIQRANLFLVCLDSRGQWFRYHHLFRDLLRLELARSEPGLVAGLHRRACAWHRARGDVDEAMWVDSGWLEVNLCLHYPRPRFPSQLRPPNHGPFPDVPVLMLNGDIDLNTPLESATRAKENWPNSVFLTIKDATHVTLASSQCAVRTAVTFLHNPVLPGPRTCASPPAPN